MNGDPKEAFLQQWNHNSRSRGETYRRAVAFRMKFALERPRHREQ